MAEMLQDLSRRPGFRWALIAALVGAVALTISVRGLGVGLLVLAAMALVGSILLVWGSIQTLAGETQLGLEEALSLAAPRAEEEQKRAVLRALKDLEYERSVGKINEEDYRELSARYREQAKQLLRELDLELAPNRARVLRQVEKRLAKEGLPVTEPADYRRPVAPEPEAEPEPVPAPRTPPAPTRRCAECDVRNDLDARFCKGCGQALAAADQVLCSACPARFPATDTSCPECGVERTSS
jgi:hypothetical protein